MANTVYHYTPTSWVNGTTPANATNLNHLETGPLDAISGLNPDLFTAFVLSGITCTKDGTNANQLDIAAGRAYVTQADGTLALIVVAADNTHTTTALSSTYFLYLQPDGTWYWSMSNAPAANSLFIAQVTTDASGNILAVTDERTTFTALLSGMGGHLNVPKIGQVNGQASVGSFGMPVIVAQVLLVNITDVNSHTILAYTPSVTGHYRVSAYVHADTSGTSPSVALYVFYTDPHRGTAETDYLLGAVTTSPFAGNLSGTLNNPQNANLIPAPAIFYVNASSALQVIYQSFTATPNDWVSVFIERLA